MTIELIKTKQKLMKSKEEFASIPDNPDLEGVIEKCSQEKYNPKTNVQCF